ncbi:leukocyte tyrosine kinase receptor [Nematostella vectensis]|uniref:leukocyte tyrosine kinase receptor n=1 Tax=Nematostella vectensis TaxID=45351 RepID=UPI002077141A|nr:leukocyte tyrosine kinase receptor [Nematostella vectensis]
MRIKPFIVIICTFSLARSTLVKLRKNQRLHDRKLKVKQTQGIMECAHRCALLPSCDSLNYLSDAADSSGTCELCRLQFVEDEPRPDDEGWMHGKLFSPERKFTFTTLGAQGQDGPVDTSLYDVTSLAGKVQLIQGIQLWIVPETGSYVIRALGASGGNGTNSSSSFTWATGGRGASIQGTFFLRRNEKLKILVGQKGHPLMQFTHHPGSGGGGSFVTYENDSPLLVAGGGGGAYAYLARSKDGGNGQASINGTFGGGSNGKGGALIQAGSDFVNGAAGGGLSGDGENAGFFASGGKSFTGGGQGGENRVALGGEGAGGFGGGGACNSEPGGGGG